MAYAPVRGLVHDGPVGACGLGLVEDGVGSDQRLVERRARVEEDPTDADGGMHPTGTDGV